METEKPKIVKVPLNPELVKELEEEGKIVSLYRCDVCGKEEQWSENHQSIEEGIKGDMKPGGEFFITCSDKCLIGIRKQFLKWIQSLGWSRKEAKLNYQDMVRPSIDKYLKEKSLPKSDAPDMKVVN